MHRLVGMVEMQGIILLIAAIFSLETSSGSEA